MRKKQDLRTRLRKYPKALEAFEKCLADGSKKTASEWYRYFGVGRDAVEQLREAGLVQDLSQEEIYNDFPTAVANILTCAGCKNMADVEWLAKAGAFKKGCARGYGKGAHELIRQKFPTLVGEYEPELDSLSKLMENRRAVA